MHDARDTVAWREGACEEGRPDVHGETGWFPPIMTLPKARDELARYCYH